MRDEAIERGLSRFRRVLFNREPGDVEEVKSYFRVMAKEMDERDAEEVRELLCVGGSAEKIAEKSPATGEEAELEDWDWDM